MLDQQPSSCRDDIYRFNEYRKASQDEPSRVRGQANGSSSIVGR